MGANAMTIATIDIERAKLDPGSVFRVPSDVVGAASLSADDKMAILLRWQADAEALLRANGEGMPATGPRSAADLLSAVQQAQSRVADKDGSGQ
jgi:hypothetical protein